MTNEEALEILKSIEILSFRDKKRKYFMRDVWQAQKVAIKALDQQTCEDYISREALLTSLEEPMNWTDSEAEIQEQRDYENFVALVKNMPSVTPKMDVLNKIRAEIDQKQYDFMSDGDYDEGIRFGLMLAYQIIDKYKAESEE